MEPSATMRWARSTAFLLWLLAVLEVGASVERTRQAPADTCGGANNATRVTEAHGLMTQAENENIASGNTPEIISTRHAVLIVPASLDGRAGEFAAKAYQAMPKGVDPTTGEITSTFTKFVVVGHSTNVNGPAGISFGSDVCIGSGPPSWTASNLLDVAAADWLRNTGVPMSQGLAPSLPSCSPQISNNPCFVSGSVTSPSLEEQLPFLEAISNGNLAGNLLPVMMQVQTSALAYKVGAFLKLLISDGVWANENVLFVFGGDMSDGFDMPTALACDEALLQELANHDVATAVTYMEALKPTTSQVTCALEVDCAHGQWCPPAVPPAVSPTCKAKCPYAKSVPRGIGPILAGRRIANLLGLTRNRLEVTNSQKLMMSGTTQQQQHGPFTSAVHGYGYVIFWRSDQTPGQRAANRAQGGVTLAVKEAQVHQQRRRQSLRRGQRRVS